MSSLISIDKQALDILLHNGDVVEGMYRKRDDGRFDIRVSDEVRSMLDAYIVKTPGLDYSSLIDVLQFLWEEQNK